MNCHSSVATASSTIDDETEIRPTRIIVAECPRSANRARPTWATNAAEETHRNGDAETGFAEAQLVAQLAQQREDPAHRHHGHRDQEEVRDQPTIHIVTLLRRAAPSVAVAGTALPSPTSIRRPAGSSVVPMAMTENETRTIDGVPLTPKSDLYIPMPETFDTVEDERAHRKAKLAGALRIFGKFGFGEGVAGHITVRDPEFPDCFWVNPFGMSFRHIKPSDLILRRPRGRRRLRQQPRQPAAFVFHSAVHSARPDVIAAAHCPLAVRQVVQLARHPARPAHPGRLHLLRRPHADLRAGRRRGHRHRGRPGASPDCSPRARPPSTRTTACSRSARPSTRPPSGSSRWSARARPS